MLKISGSALEERVPCSRGLHGDDGQERWKQSNSCFLTQRAVHLQSPLCQEVLASSTRRQATGASSLRHGPRPELTPPERRPTVTPRPWTQRGQPGAMTAATQWGRLGKR